MKLPVGAAPALLLAAISTVACGDAAPSTGIEAVTDTVDGVERVTYPDARAPGLAWAFDTTALIGGYAVDDPDYQFGRLVPQWTAADGSGNVYVFDHDGVRILGYGPDGRLIGEWGREGGGPGEIGGRSIGALAIGPGDTLWIADTPNQRFTRIPVAEPDGEPTSVPLNETQRILRISALTVDRNGPVGQVDEFVFDPEIDALPPQTLIRFGRRERSLRLDTLWTAAPRQAKLVELGSGDGRFIIMDVPRFQSELQWARFSDGGFAVQESAAYVIHLLDPTGETQRIIRRDPAPRPTTDADRQAVIDDVLAPPEGEEDSPEAAEQRRLHADALTFAEVIPRIVKLLVGSHDRMWVGVSEQEPGEVDRIDVYDRGGTLLGEMRDTSLPDRFLGGNLAMVLGRDEFDVQQIRMLRLVEDPQATEMRE